MEVARVKINLALHVLGRRTDGYHLIDSLVVFAEAGDTITATPRDESLVTLAVEGQFADELTATTAARDNLVMRAADELIHTHPRTPIKGVRLNLNKRVPIAAGLGGGSADAAATLRLLDRYWGWKTSRKRLAEIGLHLGADVPACLVSRPLKMEGIGEKLSPAAGIPALPVILVNPGVPVTTREAFRRLDGGERTPVWPLPGGFATVIEFVQWLRMSRNDLFEPAKAVAPVVARVVKAVAGDQECLFARMSGSGATVFGIFNTAAAAGRAAKRLGAAHPSWWVAVTTTGGS